MGEMVKKWKIALFINTAEKGATTPTWTRIKKSTALDISMNPQTQEFDYIVDESPTTELDKYQAQINQALTMYKGEYDYEFFFAKFFNMEVGEDAKTDCLIVFYQEPLDTAATHTVFRAWQAESVISISDLNAVDSTLTFDIIFNGTVKKGYVTVTNNAPVFTEGTYVQE